MRNPPSSSIASASPSSFPLNSDGAAAGCLSGLLRRLVCGSTFDLRTSSRSRVADATTTDGVTEKAGQADPPASPPPPSIVARLMGLESMPALPSAPQGPVGRSHSTGSMEDWPVFLPPHRCRSPQMRPSHSFRETPTFLRQENDEFLLLSFCADDGEGLFKPQQEANHEVGHREPEKNHREETNKEKPGEESTPAEKVEKEKLQRVSSRGKVTERCRRHVVPPQKVEVHIKPRSRGRGSAGALTRREIPDRTRAVKRKDKKRSGCSGNMVEPECISQNSSPVSVLEHLPELDGESLTDTSTPISDAEEEPKPVGGSRRKLSSELDCLNDPSCFFQLILIEDNEGLASIETGRAETRKPISVPRPSPDLQAEARRLVEVDLQTSSWVPRDPWKTQDFEEVVLEVGLRVLEALLQEAVGEPFCHILSAP